MAVEGVDGLRTVVLDCPVPWQLADFYIGLLGGAVIGDESADTWVAMVDPHGRRIAFQHSPRYRPPRFPDPAGSQQVHLDVLVDDVDVAEPGVLALGATFVGAGEGFRVYTDPVGHTFCLVWLR